LCGAKQRLVFVDRLLVTLVHLRLGLPHAALAELYGMDRSTVSAPTGPPASGGPGLRGP
jgi:hypothetical protein